MKTKIIVYEHIFCVFDCECLICGITFFMHSRHTSVGKMLNNLMKASDNRFSLHFSTLHSLNLSYTSCISDVVKNVNVVGKYRTYFTMLNEFNITGSQRSKISKEMIVCSNLKPINKKLSAILEGWSMRY